MTDDYYRAERDRDGHIRLNCGRGALVARAGDERQTVQGWRNFNHSHSKFAAQYDAALELFDRESQERAR